MKEGIYSNAGEWWNDCQIDAQSQNLFDWKSIWKFNWEDNLPTNAIYFVGGAVFTYITMILSNNCNRRKPYVHNAKKRK